MDPAVLNPAPVHRPRPTTRRVVALTLATALGLLVLPATTAAAQPPEGCSPPSSFRSPDVPVAQLALAYDRAWNLTRGTGVTVAVLDTGVDASIAPLAGRVTAGPDLLPDGQGAGADCAGHGTFMAGIVAAAPSTGNGFVGVAPEVQVLAVRYRDGRERGVTAPVDAAVRAAVDGGAGIILLGAPLPHGDAAVTAAVAYADERDALVVTPGFTLAQGVVPPEELPPNLVSVTSSGAVPDGGNQTSGPFDLAAPAVDITSVSRGSGGLVRGSGLEMAAAFAAGTAALVRAYRPQLTAAQVKGRILATAVTPTQQAPGVPLILDPLGAVSTVLAAEPVQPAANREPLVADPVPRSDGTALRAAIFATVAGTLAIGGVFTAVTLRASRRRRRGARSPSTGT